jgi:hypothetical protein
VRRFDSPEHKLPVEPWMKQPWPCTHSKLGEILARTRQLNLFVELSRGTIQLGTVDSYMRTKAGYLIPTHSYASTYESG